MKTITPLLLVSASLSLVFGAAEPVTDTQDSSDLNQDNAGPVCPPCNCDEGDSGLGRSLAFDEEEDDEFFGTPYLEEIQRHLRARRSVSNNNYNQAGSNYGKSYNGGRYQKTYRPQLANKWWYQGLGPNSGLYGDISYQTFMAQRNNRELYAAPTLYTVKHRPRINYNPYNSYY